MNHKKVVLDALRYSLERSMAYKNYDTRMVMKDIESGDLEIVPRWSPDNPRFATRACWYRVKIVGLQISKLTEWRRGHWHRWASDPECLHEGTANHPVGIVEDAETSAVVLADVVNVHFGTPEGVDI